MFLLSANFIMNKIKSNILLFSVYVLIVVLLFSLAPIFNQLTNNIILEAENKYGSHEFIAYGLDKQEIEALKSDPAFAASGTITNYGQWSLSGTELAFTLGHMDEGARLLGHIQVDEGRLPAADDEIALEKNTLYSLPGEIGVGSELTFTQDRATHTYTVVGLLSNYVGVWNSNEELLPGQNDLPHMLVYAQPGLVTNTFFMFSSGTQNFYTVPQSIQASNASFLRNSNLSLVYANRVDPLQVFHNTFYVVILIGCAIALYAIVFLYMDRYEKSYTILKNLGATNRFLLRTYIGQQFILLCVGIITGIFVSVGLILLVSLFGLTNAGQIFLPQSFLWLGLCSISMLAIIIYCYFKRLYIAKPQAKKPVYPPIFPFLRRRSKSAAQLTIKRSLLTSLTFYNIKRNLKKIMPVVLLIVLLFSMISFTQVYFNNMLEGYALYDGMPLDFRIGTAGDAMKTIGSFSLEMTRENYLPTKEVMQLFELHGIDYIEPRYATGQGRLIVPFTKEFFWTRLKTTSTYSTLSMELSNLIELPKDHINIIIDETDFYRFYVLSASNKKVFEEAYPDIDVSSLQPDEIIAFFPEIEYGKEYVIKNKTTFKNGDTLLFGRLTSQKGFHEALADPASIAYEEYAFTLKNIIPAEMSLQGGKVNIKNNQIVFVLTEEAVLSSPYFLGVKSVDIYLSEDITEKEYTAIDTHLRRLSSLTSNVEVYSYREEQKENAQFKKTISFCMLLIVFVLGAFTIISLFSILYIALMQRKRSYAIFRSMGMKRKTLFISTLLEVFTYLLLSLLLSLSLYFIAIEPLFSTLLSLILAEQDFLVMLQTYGITAIVACIMGVAIAQILIRSLYKESIISAIRIDE